MQGIILKNGWCNSLPGPLRCSRDQSSHTLKLDVFQLLPSESFSCPTLFSLLFTDAAFVEPELFTLTEADVCAVSSMSALTCKKGNDEEKLEDIRIAVWWEIGGGVGVETATENSVWHIKHNLCMQSTSGYNWVWGMGAIFAERASK